MRIYLLIVLESNSKVPQGLYQPNHRNVHAYGLFGECLSIRALNWEAESSFQGQYCTVYFRLVSAILANTTNIQSVKGIASNWISIFERWKLFRSAIAVPQVADWQYFDSFLSPSNSFCIPSSCSPNEVKQAVADLVGDFAISFDNNETFLSIVTVTDENQCYVQSDQVIATDGAGATVL